VRVDESVWLSGLGACAAEGARVQTRIQSRWLRCETLLWLDLVAHDALNRGDGGATLDRIATRLEVR
jgi:hypothetical protein